MASANRAETFKSEFLKYYLTMGLGAMSKKDTDALVMYLLDQYGGDNNLPLKGYSNQEVSVLLKAPVTKIKMLRYEAGLKYGEGRPEDKAMRRLLNALKNPTIDAKSGRIQIMLEDVFTKNWLQGELKARGRMFDFSYNSEILVMDGGQLLDFLREMFRDEDFSRFLDRFEKLQREERADRRTKLLTEFFKDVSKDLLKGGLKVLAAAHGIPIEP